MSAPIQEEVAAVGRRLEALANRVAELRERLRPPAPGQAAPLFTGQTGKAGGVLDDVDLRVQLQGGGHRTP